MPPTALSNLEIMNLMAPLHTDWECCEEGKSIRRKFATKGFKQALALTNLSSTVAEQNNHHPDICLGWGYCHITFTTHSISALTMLDIECAKELDALCETLAS